MEIGVPRTDSKIDGDLVADAMSDRLRRRILSILQDVEARLSLADLARELERREADGPASDVHWEQIRQFHLVLYHTHVPKLADAGLVDFDVDERTVAPVALPADVEARL